nr:YfbM family protein [uncultured Stomatobaculum sp.]
MGLEASYRNISDGNLKKLKSVYGIEDTCPVEIESREQEPDIVLDIGKTWELLHFVFTGEGRNKTTGASPLGIAVMGEVVVEGSSEPLMYTTRSKMKDIVSALEAFDMEEASEKLNLEACITANLYPGIRSQTDLDGIKPELRTCFDAMKAFYRKILEADTNVIITIS